MVPQRTLVVLFLAITLMPSARADDCIQLLNRAGAALSVNLKDAKCFCGKSLETLYVEPTKELPVKAVCGISIYMGEYSPYTNATYIQSGALEANGILEIDSDRDSESYIKFSYGGKSMAIANPSATYKRLNVPIASFDELKNKHVCLRAKAKIIINEVVTFPEFSSYVGPQITRLSPVSISNYSRCNGQAASNKSLKGDVFGFAKNAP